MLTNYQLYRRLIPGFVYFNDQGTIKSVAVLNTREWHFFPTGRVLVRFRNHRAGAFHPLTVVDVSDSWGAYRIEPKPSHQDILHRYADNALFIETDLGELAEMTLEDGRRNLFWRKDYQLQSDWSAEQTPVPCPLPAIPDASLMNTGLALTTSIEPDVFPDLGTIVVSLASPTVGNFAMTGTTDGAGSLITERTTSLAPPIIWQTVQTNSVPGGPFSFPISQKAHAAAFFRVRGHYQ